jgi:hypothetical protein
VSTQPDDVAAMANAAGLELDPARYATIATALDAFAPLLDSLAMVAVDDERTPAVFDARW